MPFVIETVPIIGMSPGNSYFKDDEIRTLLAETLKRYGCAVVFVADVPAIETYRALGYDAKKAREKAILKGNNLKNKVRKACVDLGIENDIVRIIDWQDEIADHPDYLASFGRIRTLFETNDAFRRSALDTTRTVLENADRDIPDLDLAAEQ